MEGQTAKRRRVYSPEPKKVVEAAFARNYMNYLVPALMKIKEINSCGGDIQNVVKHEVDMAMVLSSQGFAWSNALKLKLQRDVRPGSNKIVSVENTCGLNQKKDIGVNVNGGTSFPENEAGEGSLKINDQIEMLPLDFTSSPSSESKAKILVSKSKHNDMPTMKNDLNDEDGVINGQLKSLKRLIPGGEEMCNEEMVVELESYISCLQMQVNILQCLADDQTS